MDDELPRSPGSFNNRILLARELKIENILYESKQSNYPGKSILEIVLFMFINKSEHFENKVTVPDGNAKRNFSHRSFDKWSRMFEAVHQSRNMSVQKSQMINIGRVLWFYRQLSDRGVNIDFQTLVHIYCECFTSEQHSDFLRQSVVRPWSFNAVKGKVGEIKFIVA